MSTTISTPPAPQQRVSRQDVQIVSARLSVGARLVDIWRFRELLLSLVRKELKVKYKDSALGFAWSMLNPAFTLFIYFFVFQIILKNGIPLFAIYLLSGLLVWNFFSNALAGAAGSVTGNGAIIKKVSFSREVLPLASVGAALFNFALQLIVMAAALVLFGHVPSLTYILLVPVALIVLTIFASALAIFLAAVNVPFRDTQHLLELLLMFWFWATPIVYQFPLVTERLAKKGWPEWLAFLNPITPITLSFQHAFYNMYDPSNLNNVNEKLHVLPHQHVSWYLVHLGIVAVIGLLMFYGAMVVFGRLEGNFAEEL